MTDSPILFVGRMVSLAIEHKKTFHARQKVARGETWSDNPMSHACGLLGEFKIKSNGWPVISAHP